jgi:hypothetical protein
MMPSWLVKIWYTSLLEEMSQDQGMRCYDSTSVGAELFLILHIYMSMIDAVAVGQHLKPDS